MIRPRQLTPEISLRTLQPDDAGALTSAYQRNREYLEPWEPSRTAEYFTEEWQSADIRQRLAGLASGSAIPLVLQHGPEIVGRFNLGGIVRGPFQSAGLGYWVDVDHAGRGLATAAVRAIVDVARDELGLHRIEASTLLHNVGSQRVLQNAGFEQIGMAPHYLRINGSWQDHLLFQVLLHD